jgi:hypothetical protein
MRAVGVRNCFSWDPRYMHDHWMQYVDTTLVPFRCMVGFHENVWKERRQFRHLHIISNCRILTHICMLFVRWTTTHPFWFGGPNIWKGQNNGNRLMKRSDKVIEWVVPSRFLRKLCFWPLWSPCTSLTFLGSRASLLHFLCLVALLCAGFYLLSLPELYL